MNHRGWSVNLSLLDHDQEIELPVPPLFVTSVGPVIELVFWSQLVERWIHAVSEAFERELPQGHVQVTYGDLTWIRLVADRKGLQGLRECVSDLEEFQLPEKGTA